MNEDVFIVGPVRSGTSWLQTMLAEHPDLASPAETHLFANYLGPLHREWRNDRARFEATLAQPRSRVGYGLATIMSADEFTSLLQESYATVRSLVLSAKPGAHRLLEKTPDHALWLDTIDCVVPGAAIIYMVRDPRDTVRSLLELSRAPWGDWAPKTLEDATTLWLRNVRPYFARQKDPRVLLVRYEDLRSDPSELERVAKFIRLERPSEWLQTPIDAAPEDRSSTVVRGDAAERSLNPYDAHGFSYQHRDGTRSLDPYESGYIAVRCRDEMKALGYPGHDGPLPARLRAELAARSLRLRSRRLFQKVTRDA
jgi:hypothetical protein